MTLTRSRLWLFRLAALFLGLLTAILSATAPGFAATDAQPKIQLPIGSGILDNIGNFLLVADPQERKVFFYSVPDLRLTGQLDDVGLGTPGTGANAGLGSPVHSGTVVLPGGRIVGIDDVKQEIIEIRLDGLGRPRIDRRVPASAPDNGAWSAVDPAFRYFAISSGKDEQTGVVNLVDLSTFKNTIVEIPLSVPEEVHPYLAGYPLQLFVSVGGKIQGFGVAELVKGNKTLTSEVAVGTGSHGPVISPKTSTLGITTTAGLDVVNLNCPLPIGFLGCAGRPSLGSRTTVPWDVDGLAGSQNFRPRLTNDGGGVLGALGVAPADPAAWADTRQDVHAVDLKTKTAKRFGLGRGIAPRFANSSSVAVFATVHPDGDKLRLLDVRPGSPTLHQFTGEAPLAAMTNGPVAGQPTAGRERRFVAVTPNGRWAFASHGGDGKVSMVDTGNRSVREFAVPTPLKGGGYLVGINLSFFPADLMGR